MGDARFQVVDVLTKLIQPKYQGLDLVARGKISCFILQIFDQIAIQGMARLYEPGSG